MSEKLNPAELRAFDELFHILFLERDKWDMEASYFLHRPTGVRLPCKNFINTQIDADGYILVEYNDADIPIGETIKITNALGAGYSLENLIIFYCEDWDIIPIPKKE